MENDRSIILVQIIFMYSSPIMLDGQHIGFNTIMSGVVFMQIKGASHQVPQSKRP